MDSKCNMDSKLGAQQRVDQINTFKSELQLLRDDDVLVLSDQQQQKLHEHHSSLLSSLAALYDIDVNSSEKQLSIGVKIAALFGALGFAASIFFLFYQYWGVFGPAMQSVVLIASPILALGACWFFLQKEASGYYAKIAAFISLVCFVLNLSMLGQIHNITPSPNAFIIWSLMALGLAYVTRSRLLLTFAILFFAAFLSARMGTWFGIYWLSFGERPETFLIPGVIIFAIGHIQQKHYENFAPVFRIFGTLLMLLPILVLSHWAGGSYLQWDRQTIEGFYQISGFVLSASLIAYGIKRYWHDLIKTGSVMFTIFLYTKLFDWFWELFPKYLFFMLIGLSSLLILMIFKRIRRDNKEDIKHTNTKDKEVCHD